MVELQRVARIQAPTINLSDLGCKKDVGMEAIHDRALKKVLAHGGNDHYINKMPGAGSKLKSCIDVKNDVPVNMRDCNIGGTLNRHMGKEAVQNAVPVVSAPTSKVPHATDDLMGRRSGLIRIAAF